MALDFSRLDNMVYRGCKDAKAREQRDDMIEQGFIIIEDAETPFTAAEGQEAIKASTARENAPQSRTERLAA